MSSGNPTRLIANNGVPPIAYTSESAFAAAIAPNQYGSSTTGGKKSAVCTSARSASSFHTSASSGAFKPLKRFG